MYRFLTLAVLLVGCGGGDGKKPDNTGPNTNPGTTNTGPAVIDAVPSTLEFVAAELGESQEDFFTVLNNGGETLTVTGLTFTGDAFLLIDEWDETFELEPGDVKYVDIIFSPTGIDDLGDVVIHSSDPVTPDLMVDFIGHGLLPQLTITPAVHDMGEVEVPCHGEHEIFLTNTGTLPVTITSYDFVTSNPEMMLEELSVIPQPTVLNAGDEVSMIVDFLPESEDSAVTGTLTVQSDDPRGEQVAEVTASSTYTDTDVELFLVPEIPSVDLLFLIDNSCSMEGDNIDDITLGIPLLINELAMVSNWQMIEVTHTNGCSNVPILDANSPNPAQDLINNAFVPGSISEALLQTASQALSQTFPGGCNSGFLRPGALLHILVASDEPEQSGVSYTTWLQDFESYVPRADMMTVSAVVDINNCGFGAAGYIEAANATGGALLDICDPTWGAQLTNIADSIADAPPTYVLPIQAIADSLIVMVDGIVTVDFSYSPTLGILTVTDPTFVKGVSEVTVEYALASSCIP